MYLLIYFPNEIEWIYYKKEYFPSESVVSTLLQRQIAPEIFNIFFRFFRFFLFFFQFFLIGEKLCHYKYKIKIAERTQNLSRCIARASSVFWSVFSNSSNSTFTMYILDSIQIWKKIIANFFSPSRKHTRALRHSTALFIFTTSLSLSLSRRSFYFFIILIWKQSI